jgi:hypothetical protein
LDKYIHYIAILTLFCLQSCYLFTNKNEKSLPSAKTSEQNRTYTQNGKAIKYEWISNFKNGIAIVRLKGKEGVIDEKGNLLIPTKYDFIGEFQDSVAVIKKYIYNGQKNKNPNKKWGLLHLRNKRLTSYKYDYISDFQAGVAKVSLLQKTENGEENLFIGLINLKGKEICPPQYQYIGDFKDSVAVVLAKDSLGWAFINRQGRLITPFLYEKVEDFSEGIASVFKQNLYAYINPEGKNITDFKYHYAENCQEGIAVIAVYGKYGAINPTGEEIIPPQFDEVKRLGHGIVSAQKNKKYQYALVNSKGEMLASLGQYDTLIYHSSQVVEVYGDFKCGYMHQETGKFIIPQQYDEIQFFQENLAKVRSDNLWGMLDPQGQVVVPIEFEVLEDIQKGVITSKKQGKWSGLVVYQNKIVVPFGKYQHIAPFQEGLARVLYQGKYGFINRKGEEVIAPQYEQAQYFFKGKAPIQKGIQTGFVDKKGKEYF